MLLQEFGDDRPTRIAYDRGVLEIRIPGEPHEIINRLLAKIITMLAMELDMEANDFGSVTLNRQELDRGIEPDTCFYIQNVFRGQGMQGAVSPSLPPDLAREVDIASSSASKMGIYQAMQVPEVWLYRRNVLQIQLLQNGQYESTTQSRAFPMVTVEHLNHWIEMRKAEIALGCHLLQRGQRPRHSSAIAALAYSPSIPESPRDQPTSPLPNRSTKSFESLLFLRHL